MGKAVLISIRPKWVEKIIKGEKTLEVRKTRPNMRTPFKCYIYCTSSGVAIGMWGNHGLVVGECVCDTITVLQHIGFTGDSRPPLLVATKASGLTEQARDFDDGRSCLSAEEIERYLDGGSGFAWHISKLKVYDTPKHLEDFNKYCDNNWYCESCAMYQYHDGVCGNESLRLTRPPQSWCYVEELEDSNG